jgi:hypothetical protein
MKDQSTSELQNARTFHIRPRQTGRKQQLFTVRIDTRALALGEFLEEPSRKHGQPASVMTHEITVEEE